MFRKLRDKLILINLGVTSAVIIVTFTAIYLVSTGMAEKRGPKIPNFQMTIDENESAVSYSGEFEDVMAQTIREERASAAQTLLITLIASGLAIEVVVAVISYFMAEEAIKPVKEAYRAQKVFIANASHEIKTPLAAIAANLEAADISGNRFIDNVAYETEKLTKLNGELLTLARTDLTRGAQEEEVDLGQVTKQMVKSFEPRMKHKKLQIETGSPRKLKINVADFEQILSILLDNAVKYSRHSVRVNIVGRELTVENDGRQIEKDQLARVFERFYQADKTAEGVGLGLSIAKSLAERNHWEITVESEKGLTTFRLKL